MSYYFVITLFMKIGYARVSTQDQNSDLELDTLNILGVNRYLRKKSLEPQRRGLNLLGYSAY
jgi:DNA invertase Pin-like site-specific DNA recombinase